MDTKKWLKRQHLDFFLPDYNVAIEYQGEQHFYPIEYFGGEKGFEYRNKLDVRKKKNVKKMGLNYFIFLLKQT